MKNGMEIQINTTGSLFKQSNTGDIIHRGYIIDVAGSSGLAASYPITVLLITL